MGSYFGLYSIAVSGMQVNQAGLATTSHNISNVNTNGFSRQRVAGKEAHIPGLGLSATGRGVGLQEIRQARNEFLDQTYRRQNSKGSYWLQKSSTLMQMEQTLGDFNSGSEAHTGLQQSVQDFTNAWDELKKHPDSLSARSALRGYGMALLDIFSHMDQQLQDLQQDAGLRIKDAVQGLNDKAQQVAKLNAEIFRLEAAGTQAGDLRDQRNLLLDEMSGIADISVNEQANGVLTVSLGGVPLVNGDQAHLLQAAGDGSLQRPLKIQWSDRKEEANISGGSLLALMQDADQSNIQDINPAELPFNFKPSADNSISDLRQGLNDLLTTIVTKLNDLHSSGFGLDGSTGTAFFVAADPGKPISISNVKVNPALDDLNKIAAAGSAADLPGGCTVAESIYELLTEDKCFQFDGATMNLNSFYQSIVSWIGTASEHAGGSADTQDKLVQQLDSQRKSVAAVSLDEETAAMIQYQRIYSANAKVLSTLDSLLGDLIRELG